MSSSWPLLATLLWGGVLLALVSARW